MIAMTIRFVWWRQAALLIYGVPLLFWGSVIYVLLR